MGFELAKKREVILWFVVAGFIGTGASLFMVWLALLGPTYTQTYREFLSYMFYMIIGIGIPSEISTSPSNRPKLAIIIVGCFFGCVIAYFLPELGHSNESYLLGPISILGFTAALFYFALAEIASERKRGKKETISLNDSFSV